MRLQFCLLRTMGPRRGRLRATQQERERERGALHCLLGCVVAACSFGFGQKNVTFGLELLLFNVAAAK